MTNTANTGPKLLPVVFRMLTFRASPEDFASFGARHLAFGLFFTWLAGMGRYWDSPDAHLIQSSGLASLALVFVLGFLLWLVILPLKPKGWTYVHVLTFVTLTAPPALLYAIPVERWVQFNEAQSLNGWFLAIVAAWRVSLYAFYLTRHARLSKGPRWVGTLLPLTLVVSTLTFLNLEKAVFNFMSNLHPTTGDSAYLVLLLLTGLSILLVGPLLLGYGLTIFLLRRAPKKAAAAPSARQDSAHTRRRSCSTT